MEKWKVIEGYPDYMVSDQGRIKSIGRWVTNKNGIRRYWKERILKATPGGEGYLCIVLGSVRRKNQWVHKLVANAFVPNPENKRTVNHKDTNKQNNKAANLEWATHKENMDHAVEKGLFRNIRGSRSHWAKLTERQVRRIKKRLANGESPKTIAPDYDVTSEAIQLIANGKNWKHV